MPYKNTLEAIYIELNEIQQNIAVWSSEGEIRNIDIDLSLAKLRDVYDLLLSLKESSASLTEPTEEAGQPKPQREENKKEHTPATEPLEKAEEKERPVETKTELQKQRKAAEVRKSIVEEKSSLGEKFSADRPTLNEELSSQVISADLANQLKNRPITNLSSAIGLNEKFEFIHTLFHGDKEAYEATIDKLNMATNFNEAYTYLNTQLQWDMSDPLVQRILELIRRKLIVNKNES